MKKENLGLELIQTRLDGLTEIWVEVECEDEYYTEVLTKTRIDITGNLQNVEKQKKLLKKVRNYVAMGKAVVTLYGIGDSTYDKREFYRITNRWYHDVELRPLHENQYEIHQIVTVDTPLKATNAIMKAIEIIFDHVKEAQK